MRKSWMAGALALVLGGGVGWAEQGYTKPSSAASETGLQPCDESAREQTHQILQDDVKSVKVEKTKDGAIIRLKVQNPKDKQQIERAQMVGRTMIGCVSSTERQPVGGTLEPSDTQKPTDTQKPSDTQPSDTQKPSDTQMPSDTQKPSGTQPDSTNQPSGTPSQPGTPQPGRGY